MKNKLATAIFVIAANVSSPVLARGDVQSINADFKPAQIEEPVMVTVSYRLESSTESDGRNYRIVTDDIDYIVVRTRTKHERQRRELTRWELAYQTLNAIDAVQTIVCVQSGKCREGNPLLGSNPSIVKTILFKAGIGVLNFVVLEHTFKSNPEKAIKGAKVSTFIQGGMVALNMRFAF